MKKIVFLLLFLFCFLIPVVHAHEQLDDGWHIVVKNLDSEKGKNWNNQAKEWAYYEKGKEILRYSKLLGSHRGWGEAPENSLASFQMTRDKGYYAFETDVRFTKDNVAVLSHDATINNVARNNDLTTIANTTYVKDLTYEELKNNYVFNVERVNHSEPTVLSGYNTNRITSFEEMIDFVKTNKMYVSIELKEGTKEQIESLVKMTQQKKAHNYVRWISFYTDLLEMVKNYDSDEALSVNTSSSCGNNPNLYCGENPETFYNKLKTDNNVLWLGSYNSISNPPAISCAINLPTNYDSNLPNSGVETPIPQGKLSLSSTSEVLEIGKEVSISYQYDGDGEVRCKSSNTSQLSCSVDNSNHKLLLNSVGDRNTNANVTLYATQGIQYSATTDSNINVSMLDKKTFVSRQVKKIDVDGYSFNFQNDVYQYRIKIGSEKELKLNVQLDSDSLRYTIEGNQNLENGSTVKVNILQDNETIVTYQIDIEKDLYVPIPNTLQNSSKLFLILAFVILLFGIGLIHYSSTVKK